MESMRFCGFLEIDVKAKDMTRNLIQGLGGGVTLVI